MVKRIGKKDYISLRKMNVDDISFGMKLKSYTGWNQVEADWEMFLNAGGENFIANLNGRDAGTVTSIPYSDHFTWIGMVLVDPGLRRKGIGTALLKKSIEQSRVNGPVRLDATTDGYELYKTLGFRKEYELVRMVRKSDTTDIISDHGCSLINENDLSRVMNYDKPVFGADRSFILQSLYSRNPEYAFCIKKWDSINGYCLGRSGSQYEQIGPVVTERSEYAMELCHAALQKCLMKNVVIDAFTDKSDWILFLEESGFSAQRTFIRMCLGDLKHKGITKKQFAIAGPEIG